MVCILRAISFVGLSTMSCEDLFDCVFCKETFSNKETLQEHFRKHGDRTFDQNVKLVKKPASDAEVAMDRPNVGSQERVQCDVCDEEFPTISKAITHKHKAHPDHDTKYFCSWCGKLFTMKHLYNKHYANHKDMTRGEDDDVFHCDCCDIDFYLISAMLYHNMSFHRASELPDLGHSRKQKLIDQDLFTLYYCPFCGEENINKVNINKHINDDHSGENQSPDEVLRCPLCDAIFYHLDAYEAHLTFHNLGDIYNGVEISEEDQKSEYTIDTVPPIIEKVEAEDDATTLEDLLQMADDDPPEKRKHKKKKKNKKSKKETITLDEFLSMSDVLGGEGIDIQGIELVPTQDVAKTLKAKPKPQVPRINRKPVSQIEKLKQQGITVKKANNPGVPMLGQKVTSDRYIARPKNIPLAKVTPQPSSSEVLSKLLNQNQSQLVISKKSAANTKNSEEAHKDLSSPELFNKSHESLEVECDLLPCSSDTDKIDTISTSSKKSLEEKSGDDNPKINKTAEAQSNSPKTESKSPKISPAGNSTEAKKLDSRDLLKNLSHLITVKTVSNKENDKNVKEDAKNINEKKCIDDGVAQKEITDSNKYELESTSYKTNIGAGDFGGADSYDDMKSLSSKVNSTQFLKNISQHLTTKTMSRVENVNDPENTEQDDQARNKREGNDSYQSDESEKIINSDDDREKKQRDQILRPYNSISSKNDPCTKYEKTQFLKNLGRDIVIKSPPRSEKTTPPSKNIEPMQSHVSYMDIEDEIQRSIVTKASTGMKLSDDMNNTLKKETDNKVQNVIKSLGAHITIKSNNSMEPQVTKEIYDTEEGTDFDGETYINKKIVNEPFARNINSSQTTSKNKETSGQFIGSLKNDNKILLNTLKNLGQHITVKPSSPKTQLNEGYTKMTDSALNKAICVQNQNMQVVKKLSQNLTVKSLKKCSTDSDNDMLETEYNSDFEDFESEYLPDAESSSNYQNKEEKPRPVLNLGREIIIKPSSIQKSDRMVQPQETKKGNSVQAGTVSTINKAENKGICKNSEIFSVEDSDSDDIDHKTSSSYETKAPSPKVKVAETRPVQTALPSNCIHLKNITMKPVIKNDAHALAMENIADTKNYHNDESEYEDIDQKLNISKLTAKKPQELFKNNKNITVKSSNSAQMQIVKNVSQKQLILHDKTIANASNVNVFESHFDSGDDIETPKAIAQGSNEKSFFGKESVVNSFRNFDSDSDDRPHEDNEEDAVEEENLSIINKLKNMNKNLCIKSNNTSTISKTVQKHQQGIKRNALLQECTQTSLNKQVKADNVTQEDFKQKHTNSNIQRLIGNQVKTVNQQDSTSSSNTVQQKVTTSVKRIETETVVEEITTTVTRTIKTVNQSVNKQVIVSGSQNVVPNRQPVRFAKPTMMPGPRPNQVGGYQGTKIRGELTNIRPKMRPNRPNAPLRLPNPSEVLPGPRMRANAPNIANANSGARCSNDNKPLKVSPNVINQLNRTQKGFTNESPSHFSCFRKPKESIMEQNNIPMGFSSVNQESNFSNVKSIQKSDAMGTSQIRTEVKASAQQQVKLSNLTGVRVMKRSMSQQVSKVEQSEVSPANRSTMEAIERLQRSGLLVKKPRVEENEAMHSYSEDEDEPSNQLLAIEDGT